MSKPAPKAPRPAVVYFYDRSTEETAPVAIIPADDSIPMTEGGSPEDYTKLDAIEFPLTWDDYHHNIRTRDIDDALTAYLSASPGGTWYREGTGGGCDAFATEGIIGARPVQVLVTEAEDPTKPILGWARGITVGFYDAESGDMIGDTTYTYGNDAVSAEPPMTAERMRDAIAHAMSVAGFVVAVREVVVITREDVTARIHEKPNGDHVLTWHDGIANEWSENYPDLPVALVRLACLMECERQGWATGFRDTPAEFTAHTIPFIAKRV